MVRRGERVFAFYTVCDIPAFICLTEHRPTSHYYCPIEGRWIDDPSLFIDLFYDPHATVVRFPLKAWISHLSNTTTPPPEDFLSFRRGKIRNAYERLLAGTALSPKDEASLLLIKELS